MLNAYKIGAVKNLTTQEIEIISFCFKCNTFSRWVRSCGYVSRQKIRLGPVRALKSLTLIWIWLLSGWTFWGFVLRWGYHEIWYVSKHRYLVSKNIPFSAKALLILLMLIFFLQKISIFGKNSTFTQSNSVKVVLEIFKFCFQFL